MDWNRTPVDRIADRTNTHRMAKLPTLPPPTYTSCKQKSCPFLDCDALADKEKEYERWVRVEGIRSAIICISSISPMFLPAGRRVDEVPVSSTAWYKARGLGQW